jgi:hypothetical protein
MKLIRSPDPIIASSDELTIFLGGSIELGTALDWQSQVVATLGDVPVTLFNPRRTHWGDAPPPDVDSPQLQAQIQWELDALETANIVAFHFCAGTLSPISLLELGIAATNRETIVSCDELFWRRPNVKAVCERFGLRQVVGIAGLCVGIKALAHDRFNGAPTSARKKASR